jgi:hypothetical protein
MHNTSRQPCLAPRRNEVINATNGYHAVKEEHMRKAGQAERRNQLDAQVCASLAETLFCLQKGGVVLRLQRWLCRAPLLHPCLPRCRDISLSCFGYFQGLQ